jgi:hypothetical protein
MADSDEAGPRWPRARATGSDVARPAAATRGLGGAAATLASRGPGVGPGGVLRLATQAVTVALCSGVPSCRRRNPGTLARIAVLGRPCPFAPPSVGPRSPRLRLPWVCVDVCVSVCVRWY